jgi:hypothetical protein
LTIDICVYFGTQLNIGSSYKVIIMNPILRNILAVFAGIAIGSVVNMGIIMISGSIIPPPEGVDVANTESLKAGMHLFEPKHFLFPFLAHALGTLIGAFAAARIAATNKMKFALAIGAFFLLGGIWAVKMLSSPIWFAVVDLVAAYIPMGWLGGRLAARS